MYLMQRSSTQDQWELGKVTHHIFFTKINYRTKYYHDREGNFFSLKKALNSVPINTGETTSWNLKVQCLYKLFNMGYSPSMLQLKTNPFCDQ